MMKTWTEKEIKIITDAAREKMRSEKAMAFLREHITDRSDSAIYRKMIHLLNTRWRKNDPFVTESYNMLSALSTSIARIAEVKGYEKNKILRAAKKTPTPAATRTTSPDLQQAILHAATRLTEAILLLADTIDARFPKSANGVKNDGIPNMNHE